MKRRVHIYSIVNRIIFTCGIGLLLLIPAAAAQNSPARDFHQLVAQANAARSRNDLSDAIHLYRQALQVNPNWSGGWWYLGSLQYATNADGPAIQTLSHYIDLAPNAGPAYALRGLCEYEVGQYSSSLQDLQQAIALGAANNPRNAAVLVLHEALILTRLGRFHESIARYKLLIQHGVRSSTVFAGLGLAGLRMPILPKDLPSSKQPLVSQVGQAATDLMDGDRASGRQLFEQVLHSDPAQPHIHYFYGYLLSRIDLSAAIAQFKQELKLSPHSAQTLAMLAWDLGLEDEYPEALGYAQKAYAEDPSLPMAQLQLGEDLVETGQFTTGLPYLKAVLQTDPRDLDAHLELAKAYADLGRSKDARRERLLSLSIEKKGATTPNVAQ